MVVVVWKVIESPLSTRHWLHNQRGQFVFHALNLSILPRDGTTSGIPLHEVVQDSLPERSADLVVSLPGCELKPLNVVALICKLLDDRQELVFVDNEPASFTPR